MDLILAIIWPGLISAGVHVFALIQAIGAVRRGAKIAAYAAIALCLIAIPSAVALPLFGFALMLGYDYNCATVTLGMNTCQLLNWSNPVVLAITNLVTLLAAGRAVQATPGGKV